MQCLNSGYLLLVPGGGGAEGMDGLVDIADHLVCG